jgi:multiple antibiotic resistance protein
MSSVFDVKFFWQVFVTLLVIMDPPGVVPPFLGLTNGLPPRVRNRLAWQAAVVGLGVIVVFALFGQSILAYLGVELPSLQAAGGLLLLLVALQLLTGSYSEPTEEERTRVNVAFVPLGTRCWRGRERSWPRWCSCSAAARWDSSRRSPWRSRRSPCCCGLPCGSPG